MHFINKRFRCLTAFSLCVILLLTVTTPAFAETLAEKQEFNSEYGVSFEYSVKDSYHDKQQVYSENGYTSANTTPVVITGGQFVKNDNSPEIVANGDYKEAIIWTDKTDSVEWKVNVAESGLYNINVAYKAADDKTNNLVRVLKIDGEVPFSECENIRFPRLWQDDFSEVEYPILNRPPVKQVKKWTNTDIYDYDRMYAEPLEFYLEAGEHTIGMELVSGAMLIGEIVLSPSENLPNYAEVSANYKDKTPGKDNLLFEAEGENLIHKSESAMRMTNTGDPSCTPKLIGEMVMNVIGGTSWQNGGSEMTWQFEVKSAGLYQLAFRMKQNYRDGLPSYRTIRIDGEVPFSELYNYCVDYEKNWRTETISDEKDNPYLFYLEPGKHTVSVQVSQGPFEEVYRQLEKDAEFISDLLARIKKIVGQNPDVNYDYELEVKIPTLDDEFASIINNMHSLMLRLEEISGSKVSMYYQLESMIEQMQNMKNDPFSISKHISDIEEVLTTYGEWMNNFRKHPLLLDNVQVVPAGETAVSKSATIFEHIWVSVVQFFKSFVSEYEKVKSSLAEDVEITGTLDVWVGRGTDWAQLIKRLADENFTPKTGLEVKINVLPSTQISTGSANALLLAISSGVAPDICLGTATGSVGEFALRNALVDLTQFEDYDEVSDKFLDELLVPHTVEGKVYGFPETMNFTVMAYRKDVLSKLGIGIPNTWDELYQYIIPKLNKENLQFYCAMHYELFLYQYGGEYFTEDLKYSAFTSKEAYQAFKELCELYTLYGVPVTANFYNRFRTGEMPLGILDYTTYMTIRAAAVELDGKWGIAPIPGHISEDGKIVRTHSGSAGESAVIFSQCEDKNAAWSFLKWWMSDDIQTQFGYEIESLKGETARWNTANLNVYEAMDWNIDDKPIIMKSINDYKSAPVVLGGYFVSRHVTNAFNRSVVSGENIRDSLEKSIEDINTELKRRREGKLQ